MIHIVTSEDIGCNNIEKIIKENFKSIEIIAFPERRLHITKMIKNVEGLLKIYKNKDVVFYTESPMLIETFEVIERNILVRFYMIKDNCLKEYDVNQLSAIYGMLGQQYEKIDYMRGIKISKSF